MRKKISKITVKHFLNKNLKAAGKKFPLYVSIWFQGKFTKIKSLWWIYLPGGADPGDTIYEDFANYMTDADFQEVTNPRKDKYLAERFSAMAEEARAITKIVKIYFEKYSQNIVVNQPGEILQNNLKAVPDIVSLGLKSSLYNEFEQSNNIKLISARLIIDWQDFSFINLYDGLSFFSNDGKSKTRFYTQTLSQFETGYFMLKHLYSFNESHQYGYRFYQWLDTPSQFDEALAGFLKQRKVQINEIDSFINLCNSHLKEFRQSILSPVK